MNVTNNPLSSQATHAGLLRQELGAGGWQCAANCTMADESAMRNHAKEIATLLQREDVLLLDGDLGMGKTVFARAVIQARMEGDVTVQSPTFSIVQTYAADVPISHYDLYRVEHSDELLELGLDEAMEEGVTLIEWPTRGVEYLDASCLLVSITQGASETQRVLRYDGNAEWCERLHQLALSSRSNEERK